MTMNKTISNKMIDALADSAILKSAEEENIELGVALKNISKEELRKITGKANNKKTILRPWMWQAASMAAMVVFAVVTVLKVQQNSNDTILQIKRESNFAVENTLVAYNYVSSSRDGIEMKDISSMSQDELKIYIQTLQTAYDNAPIDDIQECQVAGMNLAMAYLKLHEREKTISLLNELKSRFSFDEDYVAKCNKIISLLQ